MKKSTLNILADAVLLVLMAAMTGTGLLIRTVLIPGEERWEVYGRNVNLTLAGLDRYEWGMIHLQISAAFVVLLILHIALHWKLIKGLCRRIIPGGLLRWTAGAVLILVCFILAGFPIAVKPEVSETGGGGAQVGAQGRGQVEAQVGGQGRGQGRGQGQGQGGGQGQGQGGGQGRGRETWEKPRFQVPAEDQDKQVETP